MRRAVLTVFALAVLALAGVAVAAPSDPQISIDPIDQAWAESIVLAGTDFGQGWEEQPMPEADAEDAEPPTEEEEWCEEGTPDRSDLVATGGASSPDFTRSDRSTAASYSIVWETAEQAQAEWDRTLLRMPAMVNCLAALLNGGPKAARLVAHAAPLTIPAVTPRSAAYRIKIAFEKTVRVKKKRKRKLTPFANFDIVLFGEGRASVVAFFDSYNPRTFSTAFERSLIEKMAARMASDPADTNSP